MYTQARSFVSKCLLLAFFTLSLSAVARADSFIFAGDSSGYLWHVDPATGAASRVGLMSYVMTDIALSPTGELYGINFYALFRIDPTTGAVTMIGRLGVSHANGLAFGPGGVLYLSTYAGSQVGELRTVNLLTGATTLVGPIGYSSAGDLAFSSNGTLFMTNEHSLLIVVDPRTGAGHAVGSVGFSDIYGLAWLGNRLYGLNLSGQLLQINTTTGAGTLIARTNPSVSAWGATSSPVPEPASLILFSTGAALAASLHRRRQRPQSLSRANGRDRPGHP